MRSLSFRLPTGPVVAIAWLFAIKGFMLGNWISRIPAVANRLDLDRGGFGTVLLVGAVGAITSFQFAGPIITRWGSARACLVLGIGYVMAVVLFVSAPNVYTFAPLLFGFGFFNGAMDVAINAQGVEVERRLRRQVLSFLHACFSLGSLIGTATGALFAAFEVATFPQMLVTGTISMTILLIMSRCLVPDAPHTATITTGPRLTFPSRIVLPLAMIAFTCALVEESVADWGALYLDQDLGTTAAVAAIGYTVLATMMLIGRVFGDRMVRNLGAPVVVRAGVLLSSAGLGFGIIVNVPWSMFVAFGLIGLGFSTVLPVVYRAVGTMPGVRPGQAVASVATTFYLAFLVGPLVIGWVADFASLRVAFALVAIAMLAIVALAPSLRIPQRPIVTPTT